MKTISVRQPEAWLIVNGFKDVENRTWRTSYRGWLLIHAGAKKMTADDWEYLRGNCELNGVAPPASVEYGGVVGIVWLDDCVVDCDSEWFDGPIGWLLSDPAPLPFRPVSGRLGLFDVAGYEIDGDELTIPQEDK